jgi:hypothetical protein
MPHLDVLAACWDGFAALALTYVVMARSKATKPSARGDIELVREI